MDNWDKRVQAITVIWGSFAGAVGISGFGAGMTGEFNVYMLGVVVIAALAALLATLVVWGYDSDMFRERQAMKAGGKAKREPGQDADVRALMLVQLLNDDEREALKRELLADLRADGETVSLADLLGDQGTAARQHRA
ncbi:MAG TPA: hypothetical protein PKD09_18765 [Aggregatilinea sp.]|jgi:hypothetical protein|uniref:hypothetical protein n=1 Tax=Aggregatilinea sp. TaxID=2806333 RepID=UPI002BE66C84|nr:hypothetical protein [Aggregatilinea sp.]HML23706.1 hypothetical protein [Aggregatilinea sp.]